MKGRILTDKQIAAFAVYLKSEEKSENTVEKYIRDVRAFATYVGDAEITKETVITYKNNLLSESYAARSVNSMLASINSLLSFLGWADLKVKSIKLQRQMGNDETDIAISVINCENKGQVICDEAVAGIIGKLSVERSGNIKIENCVNNADISGKGKASGIICDVTGAVLHQEGNVTVSGCKNTGNIVSEGQYSAGVVTYLTILGDEVDFALTLDNCSNEGAVKSTQYAGGILGFSNIGFNAEVSAEDMNFSDSTKIVLNKCNNAGSVTTTSSNSMAGGIVGVLGLGYIPTEIKDCVNSGNVAIDFTLTDEQIAEAQGSDWTEFYQIGGGIVGRIGDALKLTTAEGVKTSADNVNAAEGNIVISGCKNTGKISAPDYSQILNKYEKPLYVNYLGGVVGQCSATDGYAFAIENCTYSGAERGLRDTKYPDFGTKN